MASVGRNYLPGDVPLGSQVLDGEVRLLRGVVQQGETRPQGGLFHFPPTRPTSSSSPLKAPHPVLHRVQFWEITSNGDRFIQQFSGACMAQPSFYIGRRQRQQHVRLRSKLIFLVQIPQWEQTGSHLGSEDGIDFFRRL